MTTPTPSGLTRTFVSPGLTRGSNLPQNTEKVTPSLPIVTFEASSGFQIPSLPPLQMSTCHRLQTPSPGLGRMDLSLPAILLDFKSIVTETSHPFHLRGK